MSARLLAERMAAWGTRLMAIRLGEVFPFYHVIEHPKSGGTWLARMIADYLQLPFPQHSVLPLGFRCVVQSFGRFHPGFKRVVYLYRDGRDVMTSLYFDRVRVARHANVPGSRLVGRTYERLFGAGYDPADIVRHMPKFIEFEFDNPGRGTPLNWRDHIDDWLPAAGPRSSVVYVRYEDLLDDCPGTLRQVIEQLTGEPVDARRIREAVTRNSMVRQTGRLPGDADETHHIRKGVAGDWKSRFNREAALAFDQRAGACLVRLGYEPDRSWVEDVDLTT